MNPSMMIILLSPRQRTTSTMATPADATRDEMTTSPSSPRGVGEYESTPRLLITKMVSRKVRWMKLSLPFLTFLSTRNWRTSNRTQEFVK